MGDVQLYIDEAKNVYIEKASLP